MSCRVLYIRLAPSIKCKAKCWKHSKVTRREAPLTISVRLGLDALPLMILATRGSGHCFDRSGPTVDRDRRQTNITHFHILIYQHKLFRHLHPFTADVRLTDSRVATSSRHVTCRLLVGAGPAHFD